MTRGLLVALVAAAALAAPAGAQAPQTNECRGLMVCVPVPGPWVTVPARGAPPIVRYQLACPGEGRIVGGLDALISSEAVAVSFDAKIGSPVNPGISTTSAAVFTAVDTGTRRGA